MGKVIPLRKKGFGGRSAGKPGVVPDWRELGSPSLTARARKYLGDRGIAEAVARINNLRSLPPEETSAIWGPDCEVESLLVPYGKDYGTARLFDLPPDLGKFRTTPGADSRLYRPTLPRSFKGLTWEEVEASPTHDSALIEGPFKALAAVSHGILAAGISGSWNWQKDRRPIAGLRRIEWAGRRVTPIFDADIADNCNVALPFLLLGDWLSAQGANVQFLRLPGTAGPKAGIDDHLRKFGREKVAAYPREPWDSSPELDKLRNAVMRATEGGLAALFVMQHAGDVRHDAAEETWFAWNGVLWLPQPKRGPDVQERMKGTVRSIIADANAISNAERRKRTLRWGANCDTKRVIRGAMDLASSDPRIRIRMDQFDRDSYLLGTQSGVLDLRTATPTASAREQLVSRAVAVKYDPGAKCPRWRKFIAEIACGDRELAAFLQRLAGYFLIGGNPLRLIFFLFGIGRNGKSVFIEILLRLMGDYGEPAKSDLIMKHRADRDAETAQPFMLKLRGKRFITASEVGEGMQLDAAVVKTLTGGDELTVRGLHAAPVRFTVEGKIVARCNNRPIITNADQAIWDRVVEIPFDLRLTEESQDTALPRKLADELPGILVWALEGCLQYQRDGLQLPEKVQAQTAAYRSAMDTVTQWMEERIAPTPDISSRLLATFLYSDYEAWCVKRSQRGVPLYPASLKEFTKRLRDHGYKKTKANSKSFWIGIRLRD